MKVPIATKVTAEEKIALEFLAAKKHSKPAELIRKAIMEKYGLDSASLQKEAFSFFGKSVR